MPEKEQRKVKDVVVGNFADERGRYRVVIRADGAVVIRKRWRFESPAPLTADFKTFDWSHGF